MRCKCGLADVTQSDHVDLRDGIVHLHGRDFCENWRRDGAPLAKRSGPPSLAILAAAMAAGLAR